MKKKDCTLMNKENKEEFEEKIKDFDKKILEASKEENLIPTCPKCGSTDMTLTQMPAKIYFREIKDYYCRNCKYEGPPIMKKRKK